MKWNRLLRPVVVAIALVGLGLAPVTGAEGSPSGLPPRHMSAPDFDLAAVQIRIATARALAEHAFLVIETMRTSADASDEFDAAVEALEDNTAEIEALMGGVLDPDEAEEFGQHWRDHIAFLVDYARAIAEGDADATALAERQLHTYSTDFSALLVRVFPNLPADVVEGLVGEHISQLEQVTSLSEGDYAAAYEAIRGTYAHMFAIGDGITVGALSRLGPEVEGRDTSFSPAVNMRLTLDRLLGEHTYLAAIVMRAELEGGEHLKAALGALGANSAELADQIDAIYGTAAASAFSDLWTQHTSDYLDYVQARGDGDGGGQQAALDALAAYRSEFSTFLADANPHLDAATLESLLESHTHHLVRQVDAFADRDYGAAFDMLRAGYDQTEDLAAGLAGAIADQFPQMFPDTAIESEAEGRVAPAWLTLLGFLLVAAAGASVARGGDRRGP
jgi:hypothetical protein